MNTRPHLAEDELALLEWLSREEFSQYGECRGPALDRLLTLGLVQIHAPGQHQAGFIAKDLEGKRGDFYRAVSLTNAGVAWLRSKRADDASHV